MCNFSMKTISILTQKHREQQRDADALQSAKIEECCLATNVKRNRTAIYKWMIQTYEK